MMEMREPLLRVRDLEVTYGRGRNKFCAVQNISFDIAPGEIFGLVGESGSGKTTIGNAIMGLVTPSRGEIILQGQKINGKGSRKLEKEIVRQVQMIFQDPMLSVNSRAKINDIIQEGLRNIYPELSRRERNELVAKELVNVGLRPERANQFPYSLSGGQLQRVGIARAMIMSPRLVIADEPVSALDVSVRSQILQLMLELRNKRDLTYLMIAHDLSVMRLICDRIGVIKSGRLVELAKTEQLYSNPLHQYTRSLLSAIPIPNPTLERERAYFFHDEELRNGRWVEVEPEHFVLRD